ncbi:hypothetical protein [Aridibaculum aurantiacum]|uniref:hypothetical protein n=1 Tax=Aridibaculum aurantiacum TaxID=2810307 RepID=UPI001A95C20C|nr:hypothetical protein [Aridibaculum aurantiacum]
MLYGINCSLIKRDTTSMFDKPSILYITDLYYPARNRAYYAEDLYITSHLRNDFNIAICHPLHSAPFEERVNLVVVRNSGPTIHYQEYYRAFLERMKSKAIPIYNSFDGRGDMLGKKYLLVLSKDGYPVIPTIASLDDIELLPTKENYLIKPIQGADSIGARTITKEDLVSTVLQDEIIQPFIDFEYEVSFYFIDGNFQYALYAPDKDQRWKLEEYSPTKKDMAFAELFVQWNTLTHGIQRVDACRTKTGDLLLVELEDLNPFLSLDLLDDSTRNSFIKQFKEALLKMI